MTNKDTVDYLIENNTYSINKFSNDFLPNSDADLNSTNICSPKNYYFEDERIYYLFIMCPIVFTGVFLNLISLIVFNDKSFNSVTFKYLRLITLTDLFICLILIPYCLTSYTQPYNKYDLYVRHFYLAYIYIPGANTAINLSTFLNLLVSIERLISVGWPTYKLKLFKPSRYYMSCFIVLGISIIFNIANFFLYGVELCQNHLQPRPFIMTKLWTIYGYIKEVITRILPIIALIIANIILIFIVRTSRKRMRKNLKITVDSPDGKKITIQNIFCCKKSNNKRTKKGSQEFVEMNDNLIKSQGNKRNRQDNQLTWMTIFVAVLYTASSLPMVFAYPGIIFSAEETMRLNYKIYAAWVNILESIQCSFRFLIYFCFTTQFRIVLLKMIGYNTDSKNKSTPEAKINDVKGHV